MTDFLFVLVPLYLMVVGALVIQQILPREEAKPVAKEDKAPVAKEDKAPVDKADDAGPVGSISKRGLTPDCEKELRRTADLLRFFANRIEMGEETQSVVADMRQQEKKLSAFASSCSVTHRHIHSERLLQKLLCGLCSAALVVREHSLNAVASRGPR